MRNGYGKTGPITELFTGRLHIIMGWCIKLAAWLERPGENVMSLQDLIDNNRKWAKDISEQDPEFFPNSKHLNIYG